MATIKIEKLVYGGSGLGFLEKFPIFVPMTAVGDEIECRIVRKMKGYAEADLVHILTPSQNRVTPKCEQFGRCGGCQWQHIDYASQILWKQLILEEQLVRIGKQKSPNVLPAIPSPKVWNYRSRIKLHKGKAGLAGFYAPGSHELVEVKECLIAGPEAETSGGVFTQVNPAQNENLKSLVAGLVKKFGPSKILELYCGNGNLTFPLAKVAGKITAADSDRRAIKEAAAVAESRGLKNIRFENKSAKNALEAADCLVLDPPRSGCKEIIGGVLKLRPSAVIYVSCNPATLARDVCELAKGGYKLASSQPIDMFPQTYHIESVSVLVLSGC